MAETTRPMRDGGMALLNIGMTFIIPAHRPEIERKTNNMIHI